MRLYIDLLKAEGGGSRSSTGRDTPLEDQSAVEYESSYARRYEGVASGEAYDPDSPEVGNNWKHDEEDSVVEEAKKLRDSLKDEEEESEVSKSLSCATLEAVKVVNDLNKSLKEFVQSIVPNETEQEFLREVLGYSQDDISKGVAVISGRNRSLFNRWLCERALGATEDLRKSAMYGVISDR